jgi:hypothetical protein
MAIEPKKPGRLSFVTGSLRALGRLAKGSAKAGVAGYVAGGAIAESLGGFVSPEAEQLSSNANNNSASGNAAKQSDAGSKPSFPALKGVKAKEVIVKPKLGPLEGKYAAHLNLIIIRQAKLESAVSTQNNLIKVYNNLIDKMLDQNRRFDLDRKRKEDEEDLESKNKQSPFEAMKESYEKNSDSILKTLAKIAAGGLATAGLIGLATGDIDPSGENILNTVADAVDTVDSAVTTFTETVAPAAAALAGARQGTALTGAVNDAKRAERKSARADRVAAAKGEAPAKKTFKQKLNTTVVRAADAVAKPLTRLADPYAIRNEMARTGNTALASRAAKAQKFVNAVRKLEDIITGLQSKADKVKGFMSKGAWLVPSSIKNALSKITPGKIIKWYLIIEALVFMKNTASAFAEGKLGEEEWHEQNKDQLNRILGGLGGPYLTALILGSAGTVIPGIGNLVGGFAGLIVGLIVGDKVYKLLQIDDLVDALYDAMVEDKTLGQALKSFASKVLDDFKDTIGLGDDEDEVVPVKSDEKIEETVAKSDVKTTAESLNAVELEETTISEEDSVMERRKRTEEQKRESREAIIAASGAAPPPPTPAPPPAAVSPPPAAVSEEALETAIIEEIKSGATAEEAIQKVSPAPAMLSPEDFVKQQQEKFKADVASGKIKPTQRTEKPVKKTPKENDFFAQQERQQRVGALQSQLQELNDKRHMMVVEWLENNKSPLGAPDNRKDPRYKDSPFAAIDIDIDKLRAEYLAAKQQSASAGDNKPDSFDRALESGDSKFDEMLEGDDDFYDTPKPKKTAGKTTSQSSTKTSTNETVTGGGSTTRYSDIQVDTDKSLALRAEADKMQAELDAKTSTMDWQAMFDYMATDEAQAINKAITAKRVEANAAMKTVPGGNAKRAKGGPVEDGADYLVGEQGPELMIPKQNGFIIDARTTKRIIKSGLLDKGKKYLEESFETNIPEIQVKDLLSSMNSGIRNVTNLVPIMMPIGKSKKALTRSAGANGPSKQGTSTLSYITKDSFITQHNTT